MELGRSQQTPITNRTDAVLTAETTVHAPHATSTVTRHSGYGLPCAKCHLYYPADLECCPTCHTKERVSPEITAATTRNGLPEPVPDPAVVERQREEFLQAFKSGALISAAEVTPAEPSNCTLGERHRKETQEAEICRECYDRLQERLDICEASLRIDLKEAAQIVYDAVWSDPSDPGKTYENAASALLKELHKRAGLSTVIGPFQPRPH